MFLMSLKPPEVFETCQNQFRMFAELWVLVLVFGFCEGMFHVYIHINPMYDTDALA